MKVVFPWTPKTERVVEIFARWAIEQDKLHRGFAVIPSRFVKCWQCNKPVTLDGDKLWLCRACKDEMHERDGKGKIGHAEKPDPAKCNTIDPDESGVDVIVRVAMGMQGVFTADDLAVAAWKDRPDLFSMSDHPYPDNNKVIYTLCGKRGILGKGLLTKVGPKLYTRTDARDAPKESKKCKAS